MFALGICDLLIIWVVTCFTAVTVNSLWTKRCSPASETEHFDLKKLMTGISTSFYAAQCSVQGRSHDSDKHEAAGANTVSLSLQAVHTNKS